MFPDIAAIYQKNRVTGLPGLQQQNNGANSGLARNPKPVTQNEKDKAGLQKTAVSVTPIQEDKTGLQKQGYAGTRMDTSFAGSVTQVTQVTPFFNEWGEALEAEEDKAQLIREFVEVDGMTQSDATALAAQCQAPRPAAEWLGMIRELDELIVMLCKRYGLDSVACERVQNARRRQSLASIPATIEIMRLEMKKP